MSDYGDTPEQIDLYWFRAWGERLKSMIEKPGFVPGRLDCMVLLPDRLTRYAMVRLAVTLPEVMRQVSEFLEHAKCAFADLCKSLPPECCPSCESSQDFKGEGDDIWHCWACGERHHIQPVDQRKKEGAEATACESYNDLSRIVAVAADAIKRADIADNGKIIDGVPHPENIDVRDLCAKLAANKDGKTEIDIARDSVSGNGQDAESRARNLLRQARRFTHLWKKQP